MAVVMRKGNNTFEDIIINDQILFDDYEIEQSLSTGNLEINSNGTNIVEFSLTEVNINDVPLKITDSGISGNIQFCNAATGTTGTDGTIIGLSSSTFVIDNQENSNINFNHGATTDMSIQSDGDVGIGTSSPNYRLHIHDDDGVLSRLQITGLNSGQTSGDGLYLGLDTINRARLFLYEAADMIFGTSNTTRMTIQSAGDVIVENNLGIQQDNPSALLHLGDDTTTELLRFDTQRPWYVIQGGSFTTASLDWYSETSGKQFRIIDETSGNIAFNAVPNSTSSDQRVILCESGGDVGIRTFNPAITLAIGDNDTGIDWVSDGVLELYSNNNSRIHLNAGAGNIGFGDTQSPRVAFDFEDSADPRLRITDARTNYGSVGVILGRYEYYSNDSSFSGGDGGLLVDILCVAADSATVPKGKLEFGMYDNGSIVGNIDFENNGDVNNSNGVYGTISDRKFKKNIVDASSQWDDIKAIRFRKFDMKKTGKTHIGIIAQELEEISPGLIQDSYSVRPTGKKKIERIRKRRKVKKKRKKINEETKEEEDEDFYDFEEVEVDEEVDETIKEEYKTLKQSVLFMKGMVALQEALVRIEELEKEVRKLKKKGKNEKINQ